MPCHVVSGYVCDRNGMVHAPVLLSLRVCACLHNPVASSSHAEFDARVGVKTTILHTLN